MMRVEKIKEGDFELIKSWWEKAKLPAPQREMLPETSFLAYVAETPYLAVSLFLTNAPLAWIDNFIGNPAVNKSVRSGMTPKLLEFISDYAKEKGKTRLFCMSMNSATDNYYERLGFVPTVKVQAFIKEIQ